MHDLASEKINAALAEFEAPARVLTYMGEQKLLPSRYLNTIHDIYCIEL